MNGAEPWTTGGLALCLLLGVRHALEPDHVAAVDGMTLRAVDRHEAHAAWTGALFAIGHGVVVLVLSAAVGLLADAVDVPARWLAVTGWVPIVVLLVLGSVNLRSLLAARRIAGPYRPASLRMRLVPSRLRDAAGVWPSVVIGMLFALVLDTFVHVSAWSAVATARGGVAGAVLAAALFSVGLVATSTVGSQLLCLLLRRGPGGGAEVALAGGGGGGGGGGAVEPSGAVAVADRYRRGVGWMVVLMSFGVAVWLLAGQLGG